MAFDPFALATQQGYGYTSGQGWGVGPSGGSPSIGGIPLRGTGTSQDPYIAHAESIPGILGSGGGGSSFLELDPNYKRPYIGGHPFPETGSEPLDWWADTLLPFLNDYDAERKVAIENALLELEGVRGNVSDLFSSRRTGIDEALPLNPYTDEILQMRKTAANDLIMSELMGAQRGAAQGLSSRGIQGGGQVAGANALLRSGAIAGKGQALQGLLSEQMGTNLQSNALREQMLSALTGPEAGLEAQLGAFGTKLKAGDVTDPRIAIDSIGDLVSAAVGREEGIAGMDLQRELEAGGSFEDVMSSIANILLGRGNPMLGAVAGGVPVGLDWLGDLFGGNV